MADARLSDERPKSVAGGEPGADALTGESHGHISPRDRDALRSFARRIDPTSAGAHNNLGVLYYHKGMYLEAVSALLRALELDPGMKVAAGNLQIVYLDSGLAGEKIGDLQQRLSLAPGDRDARFELASFLALMGRHSDAIEEFSLLVQDHPDDCDALMQLGVAERAVGDIDVAQLWFTRALALDPDNSLLHFHVGEISYNRGAPDEAIEALRRATELDRSHYESLRLLGIVLRDVGRVDEASDVDERARAVAPTSADAAPNLALASRRRRPAPPRAGASEHQMEVSRDVQLTHYNLGLALRKKGHYAEALAEYALAVQWGEDRDLAEQAMAEVHLLNRDAPAALGLYDALLARRADSPKLWNERGVALHQAGEYGAAQDSYGRAIACDPGYAIAHNNLGVALYHAGDPTGAGDSFSRALVVLPGFVKALLNQALLFRKAGQPQGALEAYRQVLAVDAEHPVAWNGVGLLMADGKKFVDARGAFARAIQSRPDFAEARYNLSFALSNLGDFEGALRETKMAIELEPYYVAQNFELAIDMEFEDPDLLIQPELGGASRADEAVEDFQFERGAFDTLFAGLAPTTAPVQAAAHDDLFASAEALLARGVLDRARTEAARGIASGGNRVRGTTLLGDVFAKQGLWGEALERYRDACRESPNYPAAALGEATALLRLGRPVEARDLAESLSVRSPDHVETLLVVAEARRDAGDPEGALTALETARRLAPTRADVRKHQGDVCRRINDSDGAIAAYRAAIAIDSQYAVARCQLATMLAERNLWNEAERELLLALDAVPTYAEATLTLVALLRKVGRPEAAMPLAVDMLQRDPYHFDAIMALGETLLEMGRKDDAAVAFARVLRFDPRHVGALYQEGVALAEQHRHRDAMARWQEVIDAEPTGEYARRARREIRSTTDLQRGLAKRAVS